MKKLLFILMSFPFLVIAQSQQNNNQDVSNELRVEIKDGSVSLGLQGNEIKHETLVSDLNSLMNLNQDHSFKDVSERTDELGYTHFNYKQYYKGIEIDGGLLLVHTKNGLVTSMNGKVAEFDNMDIQATISENDAENIAKNALGVSTLSNHYPIKKLISWNKEDIRLVYKIRIESLTPFLMYNVFVDAKTGEIVKKLSLIACGDVPGTAKTYYDDFQTITCDSFDSFQNVGNTYGIYRLRESSNGRKIETYDGTNLAAGTYNDITTGLSFVSNFTPYLEAGTYTFKMTDSGWDGWDGASVTIYSTGNTSINATLISGGSGSETFTINSPRDSIMITSWTPGWGNSQNEISWELFGPSNTIVAIASGNYGSGGSVNGKQDYTNHVRNCAPNAHWSMEETYDYFKDIHSRDSYNDSGAVIVSYINHPGVQPYQNNAFAGNGIAAFGLGDGITFDYVTSLDIVAHEYTHNVTQYNGNGGLNYQNESGALNESFSDIFGACIEHHSYNSITNPRTPNWLIAEDVMLMQSNLRSMEEPKLSSGGGSQPNTYGGQYWHDYTQAGLDTLDHGGVHCNSGVQNKWFYLLCEGGSGINDNSLQYNLNGIGMAKAEKIAYRNLIHYLTPDATYQDAFDGSVQAATDLYGTGSTEYYAVIEAWYAVGVYGSTLGCTDPLACNYDPIAITDDGSCILPDGCTDETACNYDPSATCDDGSCLTDYGCTDASACNYDASATCDDGSCYNNIIASIMQDGDDLMAVTTPVGLYANWYNIQTEDSTTRVWLMEEDASSFTPTFECTYFIVVGDDNGCADTSETYYFGATAARIVALTTSPNPTSGRVNVHFQNPRNQFVYLHLMNSNGVKLDDFVTKNTELDIDISKYPSGTYYLHFNSSASQQGCNAEEVETISTKIILTK